MRAGTLRHRVTIQRYELVVDDYGAPLHRESWKDVATVWASVEAVSGRDFFAARQEQSEVTHKVTIRYRGDVTAQMRVLHGGKIFGHRRAVAGQQGHAAGAYVPGGEL